MNKSLYPLTNAILILTLLSVCMSSTFGSDKKNETETAELLVFTPTFYRAINLNGAATTVDGNSWQASTGAADFSFSQSGGGIFANQGVTLVPSTDANRATMIRSSVYGNTVNLNMSSVPNGYYDIYLYVWEDNATQTYSISIEGTEVQSNYVSGSTGTWSKLGPFRTNMTDGTINIVSNGGDANLSGIEVWTANNPPVVSNAIPDQTASMGGSFSYTVPSNTFTDPDTGTTLTYSANLSDGSPLPAWLSFNATTGTFSGTPGSGDAGSINIRVTASDNELTASDVFSLDVTTALYRALNLNGTAVSLDGNNWEASAGATNFTSSGGLYANQNITLVPETDATRATMIRSIIYGNVSLNVNSVPNGSYDIYLYVWEDNNPVLFSLSIEGVVRLSNYNSGTAGSWSRLGPFRTVISDGAVNITSTGGAGFSGLEIWNAVEAGNQPPAVANPLLDQSATQGSAFSYTISSNTFIDPDASTVLSYTADQSNGSALPGWLSFNSSSLTFSGTPSAEVSGTFDIRVTASDGSGGTASDSFILSIASSGASVFYRAINLNGAALVIDGNNWEASAGNSSFSFTSNRTGYANQGMTLVPATDANRATMIRSSILGNANVTVSSIPSGTYDIFLYVWEDSEPSQTYSFSIEGTVDVSNYNSGSAGTWSRLGPFRKYIGDGEINISFLTWYTVLSGIEINNVPSTVPVTGVDVSPATVTITAGSTSQLTASISPANATNQNVTWSSGSPETATVSSEGLVTGVSAGSAIITATTQDGALTATSSITVSELPVTGISVSPTVLDLISGQTAQLSETITPANATNQSVTWTSSNTEIATVNSSGLVTAVSAGSATITTTTVSGGFTATATVNVLIPVTSVNVSPTAVTLTTGQTSQLVGTVAPANASNQTVIWSSSNSGIATVDNTGLVTAASITGSATITATTVDGAFTAQAVITVEEIPTTTSVFEKFAFQYKYDGRRRMTHKKVPGADWVYMVYDDRDRLVMTQDGNQRIKPTPEWTFTKYDVLNRPVLTGIYQDTENKDQSGMQAKVDDFYIAAENNADEWFETRGGSVHGYTNQSFPNVNVENAYLTVSYYDDYLFISLIGTNASDFEYDKNRLVASGSDVGQVEQEFNRVQGQMTGSRIKNLETNEWMWSVNYYDDRYRSIQIIAENNKGGLDKITNVYDFTGKVLRTKTDHTVAGASAIATTRKLTYDHAGRLLQTEHKTKNNAAVVITKNDYNELGQLVTKKLHSEDNGSSFKQHVDHRYNIRGWLSRINNSDLNELDGGPKDFFGMELGYNNEIGVAAPSLQFNGNISAIKYSTNQGLGINVGGEDPILEATERGYAFEYDPMNRLKEAAHREKTLGWNPTSAYREGGLEYDLNGNIIKLDRKGKAGADMDDLTYIYNGNRLMRVTDAENIEEGFKDGNTGGDDYIYDANGNMITDRNKNIASITYNHMNLPSIVTKTTGEHINYIYNATGVKMSQEVYDASNVLKKKTDYLGEFFYENDTLKFINHEEGRIVMTGAEPEYQYTLKDHLGNSRITFTSKHEVETFTATMDPNTQQEEQNTFGSYNSYINQSLDPTPAESATDQILILNGSTLSGQYNGQVGLTKSFSVVPGDIVSASVNAKFSETSNGVGNIAGFAAALTQAFGLIPGTPPIEGISPFEALNAFGSIISTGGRDGAETLPQGYITILVFDRDHNFMDVAYEQVGTSTNLSVSLEIRQAGYAYVFLSNDGAAEQQIGFDNYSVTHEHSDVIQQDDYYPFGLTFNSYQRENSTPNKFKFQGQEHVDDLDLGWDSFKWRNHQPDIGRFFNVDPLAEKYVYNSPYAFSENKVIAHVELEGLEAETIKQVKNFVTDKENWSEVGRGIKKFGNEFAENFGINKLTNLLSLGDDRGGFVLTGTGMASDPLPGVRGKVDEKSPLDLDVSIFDVPNFSGKIGELVTAIDNAGDLRDAAEGAGIEIWAPDTFLGEGGAEQLPLYCGFCLIVNDTVEITQENQDKHFYEYKPPVKIEEKK